MREFVIAFVGHFIVIRESAGCLTWITALPALKKKAVVALLAGIHTSYIKEVKVKLPYGNSLQYSSRE